jgi:hypothetical protein
MKKIECLLVVLILTGSTRCIGQSAPEVIIPVFNDSYSNYVKQLEAGTTDIDYQDFRFSFLESDQFKSERRGKEFDDLEKEMYSHMERSDYHQLIKITKQMLSIDYTSMIAHKILRQTYAAIGDTLNAAKHLAIQMGLLTSIVRRGNGRACETAWPVIQTSEEYFILDMLGATVRRQSIDREIGLCDKMDVEMEGENKTYFFEITKVFEGYKKLLGQ